MHFWIGTRNQCAYTNRYRVPRLCMQGGREGACARALLLEVARAGASADMAAPVHRFAAVDWPPRPPRHLHRLQSRPVPAVHNSSRVQNDAIFVDIALDRRQRTMASLVPARRGTRDTALRETALELHRSATMARHLKLATLVFIAMAILLLAVIKHGFDRQAAHEWHVHSSRSEQTVISGAVMCAAVACVCAVGVGCALSMYHTAPPAPPAPPAPSVPLAPPSQSTRGTPTAGQPQQQQSSEPPEIIGAPSILLPESTEAPPPYKIAVLMPGRESTPPPAYSELS